MKIKKSVLDGEAYYPATITEAVKDSNFVDSDGKPLTQSEINQLLNNKSSQFEVVGETLVIE